MAERAGSDPGGARPPGLLIGRIGGVPIYLGRAWAVIALVIMATFGPQVRAAIPQLGPRAYLVALLYALLLLLSVFVHEAAHAFVARRCGLPVSRVVADLWGGHTAYDAAAATPKTSALIAVVGPLANGLVALLSWWLEPSVTSLVPRLLLGAAMIANAFVAAFNLLPGLPLDGGYLVEALVWRATGQRARGTIVAGWSGRLITVALLVWALLVPFLQGGRPDLFAAIWMAAIGAFLWMGASHAIAGGRLNRRLAAVSLAAATRPVRSVNADAPVSAVLALVASQDSRTVVVVHDPAGMPIGLANLLAAQEIPISEQAVVPVSAVTVVQPSGWSLRANPGELQAADVLAAMHRVGSNLIVLVAPHGQVYGLVSAHDLEAAIDAAA